MNLMKNVTILSSSAGKMLKLTIYSGHRLVFSKKFVNIPMMQKELHQWVEFLKKEGIEPVYNKDLL